MKKTLLVIGDEKNKKGGLDFSLKRLIQHTKKLDAKGNLNLKTINYQNALNGKLPEINDKQITIMLFFPFKYWNEKIEVYNKDERVYGGKKFGTQFGKFFTTVEKTLKEKYPDKKINYINSPKSCILDR
ncbi:MAG: hypothetical protein U9R31_00300, partial [Candidatus Omnitrophota bacterium]|nr:hypothetical protein [Candidatus Omnitrophota bacterium]